MQALATGAPSIRHAARHDAAGFLAEELERRRALRYPPFSHLIEVALSSEDEERADSAAERMGELIVQRLGADQDLLGPAPLFRVRGRHRRRLLLKSEHRREAVEAVRESVAEAVSGRLPRRGDLGGRGPAVGGDTRRGSRAPDAAGLDSEP